MLVLVGWTGIVEGVVTWKPYVWSLNLNYLCVVIIPCFSYPFRQYLWVFCGTFVVVCIWYLYFDTPILMDYGSLLCWVFFNIKLWVLLILYLFGYLYSYSNFFISYIIFAFKKKTTKSGKLIHAWIKHCYVLVLAWRGMNIDIFLGLKKFLDLWFYIY
jgi:hypothetical protein